MKLRRLLYYAPVVIAVLPLLIFAGFEYFAAGNRMLEERQSDLQKFAYTEGNELIDARDRLTARLWDNTESVLTGQTAVSGAGETLTAAAVKSGRAANGAFYVHGIYIVDQAGTVLASSDSEAVGGMLSASRIFPDMKDSAGIFTSPLIDEDMFGMPGIWTSRKIDGQNLTLAAFICADVFGDRLSRQIYGRQEQVFLLGGDGSTVWTRTDGNAPGARASGEIGRIAEDYRDNKWSGSGYGRVNSGADSIYGYSRIDELDSVVVVSQGVASVYALNIGFLFNTGIAALLAAVLILALAVPLVSRHMAVPVAKLRGAMLLAASGEFGKLEGMPKNEIGELSEVFNGIVQKMDAAFEELNSANHTLRGAEDSLQKSMERASVSEMRFKFASNLSTVAVFELTPATGEFFCSDSWERITTYPGMATLPSEYVIRYIVHTDDRGKLLRWMADKSPLFDEEVRFLTVGGTYKWVHISMSSLTDEASGAEKILGALTDINESVIAKEKAAYAAYHDALTDLPRRILFTQDIDGRLDKVNGNIWGAVYLLALSNFKQINDIYGFAVGDRVLKMVANELHKSFSDDMYIARSSGNSFLLYEECPRIFSYVQETCAKINSVFSKPFMVDEIKIEVPVCVGAAMYPDHGHAVEELIRNADIAMHEARARQLSERYAIFNSDMLYKVERTHQIMEVLRNFEESRAMYIQYQPIVRASDRSCLGFEALVRMDTSPIGFISPVEFVPLAEQSKLIIPIGTAVLRESCVRAKELLDSGYDFDHISVNVSSVQLDESDFVNTVLQVLEETGLPNERLQIEVTESMMIENIDDSIKKLDRLRNCGVTVALDDFGTGYSSMKHLRNIPLDVIKIDKHFTDELEQGLSKVFAFTMIQLAHDLGLSVVAEGVESERQFAILRERGCDYIQGYCVSRPLYSHDIERFLDSLQNSNIAAAN